MDFYHVLKLQQTLETPKVKVSCPGIRGWGLESRGMLSMFRVRGLNKWDSYPGLTLQQTLGILWAWMGLSGYQEGGL